MKKYYTSHCCPDLLAENAECSLRDSIGTRRPQDIHPRLRRRLSFQDLDAGETARMGESCGSLSRSNGRADGSKNGPCHRHTKNTMMPGSGHVSLVNQTYKLRSYIIYLEIHTTKIYWSFVSVLFCLVVSSKTRRFTKNTYELDEN